jgi:hypothetical protein
MNLQEAKAKAQEYWGATGIVKFEQGKYHVGVRIYTIMNVEATAFLGTGISWNAAFQDAEKKNLEAGSAPLGQRVSFQNHPVFIAPENPNSVIRRYMAMDRFEYLASKSKLWFARIDQMSDLHEGRYSPLNETMRTVQYYEQLRNFPISLGRNPTLEKYLETIRHRNREICKSVFVNCWQLSDLEDTGMWNGYIRENKGIAIESTYARLRDSLKCSFEQPIHIGKIRYDSYESPIAEDYQFNAFLTKRLEFEHERELRALLWLPPYTESGVDFDKYNGIKGVEVEVDLSVLVQRVVLPPNCSPEVNECAQQIANRFGLPTPVPSALSTSPIY